MDKEIFLVRHGETEYNRMGLIQGGSIDAPLNPKGKWQAQLFYKSYSQEKFDKIYTSALQRTSQTIGLFIKAGNEVESFAGLNEMNYGHMEGKFVSGKIRDEYISLSNSWKNGQTGLHISGGESPEDVAARQQPVIDLILSRTNENKILICMHGRAMRILLCSLLKVGLSEMERFNHNNCGLYILHYNDDAGFSLVTENCTAHLGPEGFGIRHGDKYSVEQK